MNDIYQTIQPVFDKYNANHNDESFTPLQKYILDKLNEVQSSVRESQKQIVDIHNKIEEEEKKIKDVEFRLINLDGQNKSLLDTLLKICEAGNAKE